MRIVIDMQGAQTKFSGHRGVGRYTENLVASFLRINNRHEVILALNGKFQDSVDRLRYEFSGLLPQKNIVVWQNFFDAAEINGPEDCLVDVGYVIREVFLNSFAPDVIFSTNLQEGLIEMAPTSVHRIEFPVLYCTTLHDLVPFYYEDLYLSNPLIKKWYLRKIDYAKASDLILTVSHSSKKDIIEKLGVDESDVFVVENGFDENLFNPEPISEEDAELVRRKYGLRKPFLFYVGGNDPHKNIDRLIDAFSKLPENVRSNVDLVLGGKDFSDNKNFQVLLDVFRVKANVICLGFVPDVDLPKLYKTCLCFVFPSTHEGFGLPALEGMACGAAVVGSRTSSIKEIINFDAALFDFSDVNSIASKLLEVIENRDLRHRLVQNGLSRSKIYSWQRAANSLLSIFDGLEGNVGVKGYRFEDPIDVVLGSIDKHIDKLSDDVLADISKSIVETFPTSRQRTIFLDVSSIAVTDYKSGIQRVVRSICGELLRSDLGGYNVELVYSATDDLAFYAANKYARSIFNHHVSPHDEAIEFIPGDVLIYLDLHPGVAIAHKEFNAYLRNKGVFVYHVVYDILPILRPETFWPELCAEFRLWADAVSSANGALCISKAVSDELKDYLAVFGDKRTTPFMIGHFHLGADIENSAPTKGIPKDADSVLDCLGKGLTFLMVGTLEPRKAHKQVLAAFEHLWRRGVNYNLVIVGRDGWGMQDFSGYLKSHPRLDKNIFWLNGITDEYLDLIYESSSCLIAASEGEGFGLPLIEAAQHGLPIIARDIPVFKEVAGDNAFYFSDSRSPEVLADAIIDWSILYEKGNCPSTTRMHWLTWSQSAEELVNVIKNSRWDHVLHCDGALSEGAVQAYDSKRLIWSGFADSECGFRWSSAKKSCIKFIWAGCEAGGLKIKCNTFGVQRVRIRLNSNTVYENTVSGEDFEIVCGLSLLVLGLNELWFDLPDAASPGEGDTRTLAVAIKSLEIFSDIGSLSDNIQYDHRCGEVLWVGFSGAESEFRWSEKNEASITFNWSGTVGKKSIEILCNVFGKQRVGLEFNQQVVYLGELSGDSVVILASLPHIKHGFNTLKFSLPEAARPNQQDGRLLSLAIRNFKFV